MAEKHKVRIGDSWVTGTPRVRRGGTWEELGTTTERTIPERFYTEGPPARNGDTITYPADGHSSLQSAINDLTSGDTLYIEPGTYQERIYIDESVADHITIESDLRLEPDANGKLNETQAGAIVENPSTNSSYALRVDRPWYSSDASLVGSYQGEETGETEIQVSDASPFSVGDNIIIREDVRPWGDPRSGGASGPDSTTEHRTVTAVDTGTDTLSLDYQLQLPFPNDGSPFVGRYDPTITDLAIKGVEFHGTGNNSDRVVQPWGVTDLWMEDVRVRNPGHTVADGSGRPALDIRRSYRIRLNRVRCADNDHYGTTIRDDSTRALVTNVDADNIHRYSFRVGGCVNDILGYDIHGSNFAGRSVIGCHWGAFFVDLQNIYGTDAQIGALRSRQIDIDSWEGDDSAGPEFVFPQRPTNVTVSDGSITNKSGSGYVFRFRMRDDNNSPYGNERFDNILIENIDIAGYGVSKSDLGHFEIEGNPPQSGSLTIRNVTYDGSPLERSDVTSWDGYDSTYIENLTVE